MRKIFNLWLLAAVALLMGACTPEVDDVFDKLSAERIAESMSTTRQILEAQSNGWIMHYYGTITIKRKELWIQNLMDHALLWHHHLRWLQRLL